MAIGVDIDNNKPITGDRNVIRATSVTTETPITPAAWKIWKHRRYVLCFMCFLGIFSMYATRICLSVAIVAMGSGKTEILNNGTEIEVSPPEFKWNSAQKGMLLGAFFYGYTSTHIIAGVLLKRFSAHLIFGWGTFVPGVLTILTPFIAHNFPLFMVFRVVKGMFQGVAIPCLMAFWSRWTPPNERARMHSTAVSGGFVGTVITLPMSGYLGQYYGWEYIFYAVGVIVTVWFVVWHFFMHDSPEEDPFISKQEREYIESSLGDSSCVHRDPVPWKAMCTSLPVIAVLTAGFCWGWGFITMLTQLPSFMNDVLQFDLKRNGKLSSLPYITMSLMSAVAGYLSDRLVSRKTLGVTKVRKCFTSIGLLLQMIFILLASQITNPYVCLLCIVLGIGIGAFTFTGIGVNYMDIAPRFSPVLAGIGNTFSTIPGVISPTIQGYIVKVKIRKSLPLGISRTSFLLLFYRVPAVQTKPKNGKLFST